MNKRPDRTRWFPLAVAALSATAIADYVLIKAAKQIAVPALVLTGAVLLAADADTVKETRKR